MFGLALAAVGLILNSSLMVFGGVGSVRQGLKRQERKDG
jgi:hypothetical protein